MNTGFGRLGWLVLLLFMAGSQAFAQRAQPTFAPGEDTLPPRTAHGWTPLRIAKWAMLAGSAASVVYGFTQNRQADRDYESIEQLCSNAPSQCARNSSNEYVDVALEQRYQSVVTRDEHAHVALLVGQVGMGAALALFLLDLHNSAAPEDIPYEPKPFTVGAGSHGRVQLTWRHAIF